VTALRASDITAYVDFSDIDESGLISIPVEIDTGTLLYTKRHLSRHLL
jgi:hypothetical protein